MRYQILTCTLVLIAGPLVSSAYGQFSDATVNGLDVGPVVENITTLVTADPGDLDSPQTPDYVLNAGGALITTWEHKVQAPLQFDCSKVTPGILTGLFDICSETKLFKLDPDGWAAEPINFGPILNILNTTTTAELNAGTESISGSFLRGGGLDDHWPTSPHHYYDAVPEPSGMALIGLGLLGLLRVRRSRPNS